MGVILRFSHPSKEKPLFLQQKSVIFSKMPLRLFRLPVANMWIFNFCFCCNISIITMYENVPGRPGGYTERSYFNDEQKSYGYRRR